MKLDLLSTILGAKEECQPSHAHRDCRERPCTHNRVPANRTRAAPGTWPRPRPRGRRAGPFHRQTGALGGHDARQRRPLGNRPVRGRRLGHSSRQSAFSFDQRLNADRRTLRAWSYVKLRTAWASSSCTSNTVYNLVICSRSFTRLLRFSSFN